MTQESPASVSDAYHTFDELYEHRHLLFIALANTRPRDRVWASRMHADGSSFDGWFIAGIDLPTGTISYHLPDRLWRVFVSMGVTRDTAPQWDGHTAEDVVQRLKKWVDAP